MPKLPATIALYDAAGGYLVTAISVVFTLIIIAALIVVAKRTKKRRGMVKNKRMKNDSPKKGK